ncbi:BMP family protein [Castellaniella sp. GW247-6E4]|uniref:BMP family protein n=1 Tax=Castellaniella sp. GW247-6E4 TaxID=3140380 RepID=UPI0033161987
MITFLKKSRHQFMVAAAGLAVAGSLIASPAVAQDKIKAAVIFGVNNPGSVNGWDRGHFHGTQKLIKEYGWDVDIAEGVPFPQMERTAERYGEAGYQVVIFTSSGQIRAWNAVAPKYPKTVFAMLSTTDSLPKSENVVAYAPDFFSYGVLNGLVAGQATDSKKIGFVAGLAVKAVEDMWSGIVEGAKAVAPDVEPSYAFSGNWTDVPRAREVTDLQIRRGADVIIGNAGDGTLGILDAAKTSKAKFVGYATDWSADEPNTVLTSVLLGMDQWYDALAKEVQSGKVEPKINIFGVDSFTVMPLNEKLLSADRIAKIEDSIHRYRSGDLKIPVVRHEVKK